MQRKNYIIAFIFIVIFSLILWQCHGIEKIVQPPHMRIAGMALQNISFDAVTLDFDIAIDNPNPFGITINNYDYRFLIENNQLFSSMQTKNLIINPLASNHLHIPLTLVFKELYGLIQQTKSLDTLNYYFEGHIAPGGILSSFKIPFNKSGKLPNIRIPDLSLEGIKMKKLDFSGVDMEMVINIINPNSFGFDLGKFNYAIQLKGTPVANGSSENLATIPAKGPGEIRLPIKIDFIGTAAALYSALTSGSIATMVRGEATFNSSLGSLNFPFTAQKTVTIVK